MINKINQFFIGLYNKIRKIKPITYVEKYKLWVRETSFGKVFDRAIRFFLITAVTTFAGNYVVGQEILPVIETSLAAAAVALYDKIKNEWTAYARMNDEEISFL